jgi:hypothetical protein
MCTWHNQPYNDPLFGVTSKQVTHPKNKINKKHVGQKKLQGGSHKNEGRWQD